MVTPKKTIGIPTLGSVKSKLAFKEEEKKKGIEPNQTKELVLNAYTPEDFTKAWSAFIDIRKEIGSEQEVAFLKHQYVLSNDVVKIQIHNSILELTFDKLKVDLQTHLRKFLKNDAIKVELEKLESESKKMLYTNKEKFNHLAEKYPAIKLLQEKLSLDPDY